MAPYTNDDLARFRYDAASMVKLLIRARLQDEPGFSSNAELKRWPGIEPPAKAATAAILLRRVARAYNHIVTHMTLPSFAADEQPEPTIEELVHDFIDPKQLRRAIVAAGGERRIEWAKVARWKTLGAIRSKLDGLPRVEQTPSSFTTAALCEMTGLKNTALVGYIKKAGVPRAKRGQRNYRYSMADAQKILATIIEHCSEQNIRVKCNEARRKLQR